MKRLLVATAALVFCSAAPADAQVRWRGMNVSSSSLTEKDVDDLAAYGPNVVRYQLSWGVAADTADGPAYLAWLRGSLDRFDTLVPAFRRNGMKVILDLHTPPGGFVSHDARLPQMRIFTERWAQDLLVAVWSEIAARYAGNDAIAAYQPVSEPAVGRRTGRGLKRWDALQRTLGETIRGKDRATPLVATSEYSSPSTVDRVRWPRTLGRPVYCLNFYQPAAFVKQGVDGPAGRVRYPSRAFDRTRLAATLRKAREFQRRTRARMYVAEFSTSRFAPPGAGIRYLRDVLALFESYRFDWTYHAWREAPVWSIEHTGTDPADPTTTTGRTDRGALLARYFAKNRRL